MLFSRFPAQFPGRCVHKKLKSRKLIIIGIILIVVDILLYGLFHDFTKLAVFQFLNEDSFLAYKDFHSQFHAAASDKILFKIIAYWVIDALWFIAFNLVCLGFFETKWIIIPVYVTAMVLEIIQLPFPALGTFDFGDLGVYTFIAIFFFIPLFLPRKKKTEGENV